MKVISVNIGEKQTFKYRGKNVETGIFKYPVDQSIFLGNEDVEKDSVVDRKYHGGIEKACYIYSADHYEFWKEKYPHLDFQHGMFGENITIEGLDESNLYLGDIYQIGQAKVEVSQPREPCFKLGARFETSKILKQFINAPYPGVYLKVIEEGIVVKGDELTLIKKGYSIGNISTVYHLMFHSEKKDKTKIKELLAIEDLAKSLTKCLKKRLTLKRFLS
jgi:MOSC domain-containing protein YiiM